MPNRILPLPKHLRAIDGSKQAKALAEARILQCPCGSRTLHEARVGVAVDKRGKTIHRGTLVRTCAGCGRVVE